MMIRPTTLLRGAGVAAVLVLFLALGVPVQAFARRLGLRFAHWCPVLCCRALCAVMGVRVRRHGLHFNQPSRLVVANHVSWLDILVLGGAEPLAFIAKSEIGRWPLVGTVARAQGTIFVERARRRSILRANAEAAAHLAAGRSVVLFAEATTGCGNRVLSFKSSHVEAARAALALAPERASMPLQPVALAYTRLAGLPISRADRPAVAWYGDMDLLPHVLALLHAGPVECDVWYEPAVPLTRAHARKPATRVLEGAVRRRAAALVTGRAADKASTPCFIDG